MGLFGVLAVVFEIRAIGVTSGVCCILKYLKVLKCYWSYHGNMQGYRII